MNYPFRMYGRTVEVYRFRVDYSEERPNQLGELEITQMEGFTPTKEEADAIALQHNGTVTSLDAVSYQWLDGLIMPDVPDTYGEAVKVYEMGQAAYQEKIGFETKTKNDQLRADLDFISLMTGVSL